MVVLFVFLLMNLAVGAVCYGMQDPLSLKQRSDAMVRIIYKKYKKKHAGQVAQLPASIGGIKALVTTITPQDFVERSADNGIEFSPAEVHELYADSKSFAFVSIYRNNGELVFHSTVNDAVHDNATTFVIKRLAGEALVVGFQKNKDGDLRAVRTVSVNIGARYVHDDKEDKSRFESEDEQWNAVAGYYSQFNKKPSRFVRDKYGKTEFCQEAAAKKILLPDGQ